jgi:protein-tyrosine phosphatase
MEQAKVLMVCLGNICRSPLAQGLLEQRISHLKIEIDSAGTAGFCTGCYPDKRSIAVAKKYGINISNQKARKFTFKDFDYFSHIFTMDKNNYNDIIKLAKTDSDKKKVKLILENDQDVPDPYYGDKNSFEYCYKLLDKACERIADLLSNV